MFAKAKQTLRFRRFYTSSAHSYPQFLHRYLGVSPKLSTTLATEQVVLGMSDGHATDKFL